MSDYTDDSHVKFGVLFVGGFKHQRRGSAVASLAAALYRWLFNWNAREHAGRAERSVPSDQLAMCDRPVLRDVALSGAGGEDGQPAHLTLSVPLHLSTGKQDATWLLAESSWADLFVEPRFLGLARWVWKVSTCLLVLQFLNPMRRHWRPVRCAVTKLRHRQCADNQDTEPVRRLAADGALAGVYVVLMGVAAMLSVLLAALLLAVALAAYLPIPRIDKAVRWVVAHIAAMLATATCWRTAPCSSPPCAPRLLATWPGCKNAATR
jgi:hypothetical protein